MYSKRHRSSLKTRNKYFYLFQVLRVLNKGILGLLTLMIHVYRWTISPMLGHTCRFYPSCSEYALHALKLHKWKGLWLIVKRLLKCGPWHLGGVDFVPNYPAQEFSVSDLNVNHHETTDSIP